MEAGAAGAADSQTTAASGEAAPKKARAFRHFAGEYVMIVLSIVTALGLENGVRQFNQAREAREAARNLDAEIAVNLAEMRAVVAHSDGEVKRLRRLQEILLADIKAGVGDEAAIQHVMHASGERFTVSLRTPSLQREAWDVAVANQALSFMSQEQLQRYARQYANMRDIQAMMLGAGGSFIDRPQLSNVMSNLEMSDITARELYRVLAQMSFVHESNSKNMRTLEKLLVGEQQRGLKQAGPKESSA
ncbi:hypothetical protein [Massilia hydrophila]|nr:hypothetical protein [Massilia oculi]